MTLKWVELEDVKFDTLYQSKLAENHIVVFGIVDNIFHFVAPLRAKYLSKILPIVFLNEEKPTLKQWNSISMFPQIYFV